jgi:hypothetical protein
MAVTMGGARANADPAYGETEMSKLFVLAVNQDGKGRYVHVDAIATAEPNKEGGGYVLKTAGGRVLGVVSSGIFNPDDYSD